MPFDTTYRYVAFNNAQLAQAALLRSTHGDNASTGPGLRNGKSKSTKTMLCGLDNSDTGNLRAMQLGVDAIPVPLSDGRALLAGYWPESARESFNQGAISGEELTLEQVKALQPTSEI